jgi:GNAT superfamily N-acetyltransferase
LKRSLPAGYELDDDPDRVDVDAVYAFLSTMSYWARDRPKEVVEAAIRGSARVVGLYHDGALVGFCRAASDGCVQSYLADVYVLPAHRGRGLGTELVTEIVTRGPLAGTRWLLHTADAHALYAKFGFTPARADRVMERL